VRTAISLSAEERPWPELVHYVLAAEKLGVDVCWVTEGWGCDAASPLGYLAAKTSRILIGSGVFQLGTRTPALIAMTALTIDSMSGGRFLLGLGASGPQVIEGLHGVDFAHPYGRMRETIEIIRQLASGQRASYQGRHFSLPRPGRDVRAPRLSQAPNEKLPLYIATLSPMLLELTGELADGWLGTSFIPERAGVYLDRLRAGLSRADRTASDLDICQHAELAVGDDLSGFLAQQRRRLAFYLGGMGSVQTNFYNQAYARQGFADVAREVHELWTAGDREHAIARIPDEMVFATSLIGTESMIRDRLMVWRDAGITTVRLNPAAQELHERLDWLECAVAVAKSL
jgi:F420-dependent oxidoreductase-like protein